MFTLKHLIRNNAGRNLGKRCITSFQRFHNVNLNNNYNRLIYNLQKHVKISNYKKITYLQTQMPMIQCNLYSTKKTIGKKKKKKKKRLNTKGKNNKFLQDNEDNVKKIVVKKNK